MSFIQPIIADASCSFEGEDGLLQRATDLAADFLCKHLDIDWGINVVITTSLPWLIIPEDGVGGKTYASDFVVLVVDKKRVIPARISEILAHELAHAIRWGKNPEWSKDLFCELVNEGLAVHIEAEFAKGQAERTFFLDTILSRSEEENYRLYKTLEPKFNMEEYDYDEIFFGDNKWPRWTGYCVGYYIVKKYLEKTGKNIFDVIGDLYEDFKVHTI